MANIADSYEDRTMIAMDGASVVCDRQTEEHELLTLNLSTISYMSQ